MNPVDVYILRKNGIIKRFPLGFFREDVNVDVSIELTKYLIEDVLKWTDEDICKKLSQKTFYENYLRSMLNTVFNASVYEAINATYPNRFNPWELKHVPNNYWTKERAKYATLWLFEEKLKWSEEDICNKLCARTFEENGLGGMSKCVFNSNVYEIIENAYPGRIKPWQLKSVPNNYWNKETGIEATKWLIEKKLKWTDEDIIEKFSYYTFAENGFLGMLQNVFGNSPYKALESAYPGRFRPWELKYVPINYWTKETAREATLWLFEEKLKWTDEDICNYLSSKTFYENGLSGMFQMIYNCSPYKALEITYPGKFIKVNKSIQLAKKEV